jgi:hypothetical protein
VALIGLTSHGRLITPKWSFNENSIDGDLVTDLEAD